MPRWYHTLYHGEDPLSKHFPLDCSQGSIIIQRERYISRGAGGCTDNIQRMYARFKDILQFITEMGETNWFTPGPSSYYLQFNSDRFRPFNQSHFCCHEVIPGDEPRKLFFDVDGGNWGMILELVQVIINFFEQRYQIKLPAENILITDSSGVDKNSYHLIVRGYRITDAIENKYIGMRIYNRLTPGTKQCIDCSVWDKTHCLRILGYCKLNTTRNKKLLRKWTDASGNIIHTSLGEYENELVALYQATLVTAVYNCQALPAQNPQWGREINYTPGIEIDLSQAKELHQLVPEGESFDIDTANIKPGFIPLRRLRRSLCPVCNRTHDNENSYITINASGRALWRCFRDMSKTGIPLAWKPEIEPETPRPVVNNLKLRQLELSTGESTTILGQQLTLHNLVSTGTGMRAYRNTVTPGQILNSTGNGQKSGLGIKLEIERERNQIIDTTKMNVEEKLNIPEHHFDEFTEGYIPL